MPAARRPMKYGCHGQFVEMQGISSISHWVDTGFTVSGVSAVSIMSILSSTISCLATSAARFGSDWLSLTTSSMSKVPPADLMPSFANSAKILALKSSDWANAASGPVAGVTKPSLSFGFAARTAGEKIGPAAINAPAAAPV